MSNYYCLNCGSLVPEGKKFCPVCGEPVIAHRTLPTENVKFPSEAREFSSSAEHTKSRCGLLAAFFISKSCQIL